MSFCVMYLMENLDFVAHVIQRNNSMFTITMEMHSIMLY